MEQVEVWSHSGKWHADCWVCGWGSIEYRTKEQAAYAAEKHKQVCTGAAGMAGY